MQQGHDTAVGRSIEMVESVGKTLLPVIATVALLVGLLLVIYGVSWAIEFHL